MAPKFDMKAVSGGRVINGVSSLHINHMLCAHWKSSFKLAEVTTMRSPGQMKGPTLPTVPESHAIHHIKQDAASVLVEKRGVLRSELDGLSMEGYAYGLREEPGRR